MIHREEVPDGDIRKWSPMYGSAAGTTPYCITQALINAAKGKIDDALLFCGAYAYQATHLETVKEVIDSLIPERV